VKPASGWSGRSEFCSYAKFNAVKVVSSLADAALRQPSVISIGNFDGLHLGHQAILKEVVQRAHELGLRPMAVTFDPHPIRFLAPDHAPRLIVTFDQKVRLMRAAGMELLFVMRFDRALSELPPEDFIKRYIIEGFKARAVCVGSNFNFGFRQSGTVSTLRSWRDRFEVIEVPPVRVRGEIASSSRVRERVNAGAVSRACRLLGRWIEIEGAIVSGSGRGRSATVPTLNLRPENDLLPATGVYVTRIALDEGPFLESVTNVGVRPTFGESELTVETFVLGGYVPPPSVRARLQFIVRLRNERRFESQDALRTQIQADVRRAERFIRSMRTLSHA
jgi:riboflavin kinase/FMN adenylyltransferase